MQDLIQIQMNPPTEETVQVGYVRDAHGLKGEIFVRLMAGKADWLKNLVDLNLVKNGQHQLLQVVEAKPHKDGLIVKTQELRDRNQAEAVIGSQVIIPSKWLVANEGETPYLHEVLNFEVFDAREGRIGTIQSFATNGAQDLFVVKFKEREVLIPFVKQFVEKLDFANKKIAMNLPPGLLDE